MAASATKFTLSVLLLLSLFAGAPLGLAEEQKKTWCVVKPSTDSATLDRIISYVCNQGVGCHITQPGNPCHDPDGQLNHASVLVNRYYRTNGANAWNCDFNNSGLITITDPSYGNCTYE